MSGLSYRDAGVDIDAGDELVRRIKPLAVTSAKRSSALPDVPSMAEAGFPGIDVVNYFALVAPAGTPAAIVQQLNAAINEVVSEQAGRDYLTKLGFRVAPRSAAESQAYMTSEVAKWGEMVRTVGVYVD